MPTFTSPKPTFSVKALQGVYEHDNFQSRERLRKLFDEELFIPRHNLSLEDQRELAVWQGNCCSLSIMSDCMSSSWRV